VGERYRLLSYDDDAADLLYKVINPRYEERRSLLVTTDLAFKRKAASEKTRCRARPVSQNRQ